MTSSNPPRESKLRKPKPRWTSSELAGQFLELQRLRREVRKLEQTNDRQEAENNARDDLAGCRK
jgi:hypothetical protein